MINIDKRALRKAAMHAKTEDDWGCDADNFHDKATPDAVMALLDELEAAEKRIADKRGIILSARNFISEYAQNGDVGAAEFVKILDRAAGIGVKGE
ncbi:hypothetical protein ACY3W2_003053 [Citrobacter freundii]